MLAVTNLAKTFPGTKNEGVVVAVDDVSFDVAEGTLFTLLGPSGCGKTTALRCVAGLEQPDGGEIAVAGRVLFSSERRICLPANARGLGMVFQSYAIWPNMTVAENVHLGAYTVRDKAVIDERVDFVKTLFPVVAERWDALAGDNPFLRHAFLDALETTGCASEDTGWTPRHVTLWDGRSADLRWSQTTDFRHAMTSTVQQAFFHGRLTSYSVNLMWAKY